MSKTNQKSINEKEGKITQQRGGLQVDYEDRIETMKQIIAFLDLFFEEKEKINIVDFTQIIDTKSSEMLLSVRYLPISYIWLDNDTFARQLTIIREFLQILSKL